MQKVKWFFNRYRYSARLHVCISAQDYGFGPVSLLAQALSGVKNRYVFDAVGTTRQLRYLETNGIPIHAKVTDKDILAGNHRYGAVISSFDPYSIMTAAVARHPSLYIDNLTWFWQIDSQAVMQCAHTILSGRIVTPADLTATFQRYDALGPHITIMAAHLCSTESLVQRFAFRNANMPLLRKHCSKLRLFGALVPAKLPISQRRSSRRSISTVYVQLGGMHNSAISYEYRRKYAITICSVLNRLNGNDSFRITCKLHPDLQFLQKLFPHLRLISTLPFTEHIQLIRDSDRLVIHPGANSIYESVYYLKQIFLLPEQAPSHTSHVDILFRLGFRCPRISFGEYRNSSVEDSQYLYRGLHALATSPQKIERFTKQLERFLITREPLSHAIRRRLIIKRLLGDYDGTETLQNLTTEFLTGAFQSESKS